MIDRLGYRRSDATTNQDKIPDQNDRSNRDNRSSWDYPCQDEVVMICRSNPLPLIWYFRYTDE